MADGMLSEAIREGVKMSETKERRKISFMVDTDLGVILNDENGQDTFPRDEWFDAITVHDGDVHLTREEVERVKAAFDLAKQHALIVYGEHDPRISEALDLLNAKRGSVSEGAK